MKIPGHFKSSIGFRLFILECAIRDRFNYLECIESCEDEEWLHVIEETKLEIEEM